MNLDIKYMMKILLFLYLFGFLLIQKDLPVNSKGPSPVIVIILSETVYPSPEEVNEIVVVNCIKIKEENNVIRNIYILLIIY